MRSFDEGLTGRSGSVFVGVMTAGTVEIKTSGVLSYLLTQVSNSRHTLLMEPPTN